MPRNEQEARALQMGGLIVKALCCLAVVFLVTVATGCTHAPRLSRTTADIEIYRAEYMRNNPDGKYNEQIMKGEVTKGMDAVEVLASWGLPHLRRGSEHTDQESWVYYTIDDHTKQVISYELVFLSSELSRWFVDNNASGQGTLTPEDLVGMSRSADTSPDLGSTDTGTLRKKP